MKTGRFDELYERYCDGCLQEAEPDEFLMLLTDPEHRARFVELAVYESAVYEELSLAENEKSLEKAPRSERVPARRKLLQQHRQRTSRLIIPRAVWVAAAACLALTAGALLFNHYRAPIQTDPIYARLMTKSAGVTVLRNGKSLTAGNDFSLYAEDGVFVPSDAQALIQYLWEDTRLNAGSNTNLILGTGLKSGSTTEKGKRISLEKGSINASVATQPKDAPMILSTPNAKAEIVGTQFILTVAPVASLLKRNLDEESGAPRFTNGKQGVDDVGTRLDVIEGHVRLTRQVDQKSLEVKGDHFAVVSPASAFTLQPTDLVMLMAETLRSEGSWRQNSSKLAPDIIVGTSVVGDALHIERTMPPGIWYLHIRYQDNPSPYHRTHIDVLVDGKSAGAVRGPGQSDGWIWGTVSLTHSGVGRISLVNKTIGARLLPAYWIHQILLTRDAAYQP